MNEVLESAAPLFALIAREREELSDGRFRFTVRTHAVGPVSFPDGRVVASDPLVDAQRPPFTRAIARGEHDVFVSVATLVHNNDQRVAAALVRISDAPVESWEYAVSPDQDLATLPDDQYVGFPVDSGTGCYGAPEAVVRLEADQVIAALEETYVHTWSVAVVDGVAVYHSGFGDGYYPTFFGLDADGEPAVLLTDLLVVEANAVP